MADGRLVGQRVAAWTIVLMAVGLLLEVIAERLRLGGYIASRLFGLAWGLATTFVVPVLALEDVGVRDAMSRSASIFKWKWGESVVAHGTLGPAGVIEDLEGGYKRKR